MPMQRSAEYWARRALARMDETQLAAERRLSALAAPYRRAQAALLVQIRGIQESYMRRYGVDEEDAREFLSRPADERTLRRLARQVAQMPEGTEKRRLQARLNAPATRHRITYLQSIREQVRAITETLSEQEQRLVTDSLTLSIRESALEEAYDLQRRAAVLWMPGGVSDNFIRQTLREDWSGENYKTRIEGRYEDLAERVREGIVEAFLGGRNYAQTAEEIAHEFGAAYHAAKRLLVTETTYVTNAANVETYRREGAKEYRIVAVLDLKTSDICQEQDGKIYPVAEAKAGENLPPFHPNCRSTTISVISREWLATVERRAKDPVTGEITRIAPGTTYPEWLKMLEEKYGKDKIDALRKTEQEKTRAKNAAVQKKIDRAKT